MKKIIFFLAISSVAVFVSCSKEKKKEDFRFDIAFFDESNNSLDTLRFGSMPNDSVRSFKIKNQGDYVISWRCLLSGDNYWSIQPSSGEIQPNGEQNVTVKIDRQKLTQKSKNINSLNIVRQLTQAGLTKKLPIIAISAVPPVVTGNAGLINSTSVRLRGEIKDVGYPAYTERGFVYSTDTLPSVENGTKSVAAKSAQVKFSADITVSPSQTYHARAYVTSEIGTVYSDNMKFTAFADDNNYIEVITESSGQLSAHTQDIVGEYNWEAAKSACENSAVGGFEDWRLPSKDELLFLFLRRSSFGGFVQGGDYWSGTAFLYSNSGLHYFRRFGNYDDDPEEGNYGGYNRDARRVRCVRSIN